MTGRRWIRLRCLGTAIVAIAIAITPGSPRAAPTDPKAAAQQQLEAGLAAYQRGDYETAIAHFRDAYELHESPQYLYAWAQAARSAGDCAAAIDLYRRFIDTGASGDSRIAAEQNVARCRAQLEQEERDEQQAAGARAGPEAPSPAEPADTEPPDEPRTPEAREAPRARPDAIGLGLLVGGAALVAAGSTVLAISGVRRVRQSDTTQYDRFDTLDREIDRLDIAGGVTLGIGAALAIGGAIRLGIAHRKRRSIARTTWLSPALGPGRTPMLVLSLTPR